MRDHLIKNVKKNTVYSKVVLIVYYTKHVKPFRQTFQCLRSMNNYLSMVSNDRQ